MDELAIRTLFNARNSGRLTHPALNMFWTLLELDWEARRGRYEAALESGRSESEARVQKLLPVKVKSEELADAARVDRRRVKEHLELLKAAGLVNVPDHQKGVGLLTIWVFHMLPAMNGLVQYDPQKCFDFGDGELDERPNLTIDFRHHRDCGPEHQREASPDQRHRSAELQRPIQPGLAEIQRGGYVRHERQQPAGQCPPAEGQGCDDHAAGPSSAGVTLPETEGARRFFGAPARRFSGAPARRFSGAPSELTDDDKSISIEEERSSSLLENSPKTSSSVSQSVSRRAVFPARSEGAPEKRRAEPAIYLVQIATEFRCTPLDAFPWDLVADLVATAEPSLKNSGAFELDTRTKHTAVAAAIVAVCVPELGPEWFLEQAAKCCAKTNRGAYLRICLAEGLEILGLSEQSMTESGTPSSQPINGLRDFGRLQMALSRAIGWYNHQPQKQPAATSRAENRRPTREELIENLEHQLASLTAIEEQGRGTAIGRSRQRQLIAELDRLRSAQPNHPITPTTERTPCRR